MTSFTQMSWGGTSSGSGPPRFAGTYTGPWDVRVTPFLLHQSGQPFARTLGAELNHSRIGEYSG